MSIYIELFLSFLQVGIFSIGGGYAAMPLIQSQAVDTYGWLTLREFTDLITIAELTPGPIAVNSATFVGIRMAGLSGALIATLGCILPSLVIVSIMSWAYTKYSASGGMQAVLKCLRPTVVALIAGAALTILKLVVFGDSDFSLEAIHWGGLILFAAAFIVLRLKKPNPILIMVICGAIGAGMYALGIS